MRSNSHVSDVQQGAVLQLTEFLCIRPAPGRLLHEVAGVTVCRPALTHITEVRLWRYYLITQLTVWLSFNRERNLTKLKLSLKRLKKRYLRASVCCGLYRGQWVMSFGHFAYEGVKFWTGNVVPSSSLEQRLNSNEWWSNFRFDSVS